MTTPDTKATVKPILQQAHELIGGARQSDYGNKRQNFSQIAMIWQGVLAHKLMPGEFITPEDVAGLMIGLKLARVAKSPDHNDSWLDIAGYVGCVDAIQAERLHPVEYPLQGATVDTGVLNDKPEKNWEVNS